MTETTTKNELTEFDLEEIILKDFDSNLINQKPQTEKELYQYYAQYTDIMVQYLRLKVTSILRPLTNEVRALFGHLTDQNTENKVDHRELEKAYGHFRRLTLDSFKILCDEYDNFLYKKFVSQYRYNFNSVDVNYLKKYSDLYISAKKAYIEAQQAEKTGSDSTGKENVIKLYHTAAKKYIELKRHYCSNKKKINRVKWVEKGLLIATVASFAFSTIVSILTIVFT